MNRHYSLITQKKKQKSMWVGHISITVQIGLVEKGYFSGFIVLSSDTFVFQQLFDCYITSVLVIGINSYAKKNLSLT